MASDRSREAEHIVRNVFLPGADLSQSTLTIDGLDAHHLATVLRMRVGERLGVLDGRGAGVASLITHVGKGCVAVEVLEPLSLAPEPLVHITVAQALGKGDKFEQVVQHGTEAGASAFLPLTTERSVVKLEARSAPEKRARSQQIAKGAAEQSGRALIPEVLPPCALEKLSPHFDDFDRTLLLHPDGAPLVQLSPLNAGEKLLLIVGPEGGFSPAEVERTRRAGATIVRLGDHVLRTETAALIAVAQILFAAQFSAAEVAG